MLGVWEAVCVRDRFCWVPVVLVLWKGPREQETEAKGPEGENEGRCNSESLVLIFVIYIHLKETAVSPSAGRLLQCPQQPGLSQEVESPNPKQS